MKQLLLFFSAVLLFLTTGAQNFSTLGIGTNGDIRAMKAYKGELYVAGAFTSAGGINANHIARWNGLMWDSVASGIQGGIPYCMEIYNNELYVGGAFTTAGNITVTGIAKWDGTTWSNVGPLGSDPTGLTTSLRVFNGSLCAGGYPNTISNATNCDVARWDGSNWTSMGMTGLFGNWGDIKLDTFRLTLYAGGYGGGGVSKFDDVNWVSVGSGLNGPVNSLIPFHNKLYIGGQFTGQGYDYLTQWNDTTFSNVNHNSGHVYGMFNFHDELYVGGGGTQFAGDNLHKWNGTSWTSFGYFTANVNCFAEYNNELYIGGGFIDAAGMPANNVIKLNSDVGIKNIEKSVPAFFVYPNPTANEVSIELKNLKKNKYTLRIYSSSGQLINTIDNIMTSKIKIETNNFSAGLFLVQLWYDDGLISTEKLIVE